MTENGSVEFMTPEVQEAKVESESRGILDPKIIGRRIKAARKLAGFNSINALINELKGTGFNVPSSRTIYSWERGEGLPSVEFLIAINTFANPSGELEFLIPQESFKDPEMFNRIFSKKEK